MIESMNMFEEDNISLVINNLLDDAKNQIVESKKALGKSNKDVENLLHENIAPFKISIDFENYNELPIVIEDNKSGEKCEVHTYAFNFNGHIELFKNHAPTFGKNSNPIIAIFYEEEKKVHLKFLPLLKMEKYNRREYVINMLRKQKLVIQNSCNAINVEIDEAIRNNIKNVQLSLKSDYELDDDFRKKISEILKEK